jgi:hypothetical protein
MLRALLTRMIRRFEARWDYDASYQRAIIAADPWVFVKFAVIRGWVNSRAAPHAALAAAGLAATMHEDCGPCTQISADMALSYGLDPKVLRAILAGDQAAMGDTAALAWRFARASLAHDLAAEPERDEIRRRWGERGLVALSMAITAGRVYPTLKYALGHGQACSRVVVAGETAPLVATSPLAA